MKKIITAIFIIVIASQLVKSQVPEKFNYQGVLRNESNELITNTNIGIQISLYEGSSSETAVYVETHETQTNSFGQFSIQVGTGTTADNLSAVNWSSGQVYLKVSVDEDGGINYADLPTVQLITVPYALFANSASKLGNNIEYSTSPDTLFVVKDQEGNPVFVVYPDGAEVITNEVNKGKIGGFAVSGRTSTKGAETEYLRVTADSTRIYVNEDATKGKIGGFAVSGRTSTKGLVNDYLLVGSDSTRIYVKEDATKGKIGGFAVSGRTSTKGSFNDYLQVTKDSTRVYISESGSKGKIGGFAVSGRTSTKGIANDYFNISGDTTTQIINPSEPRVLWFPKKEAFLTGRVLVESPDSIGTNSMATGFESKAIGDYSQAMGYKAIAKGNYSTAIGLESKAKGLNSFAFGEQAEAIGEGSYAFGSLGLDLFGGGSQGGVNTKALGYASISIGLGTVSIGEGSIAFGICDTAMGDYSKAIGHGSLASGNFSTTMGMYTKAEGYHSYAFGRSSKALAQDAISFAGESTASGIYSVSLGAQSIASGDYSTTLGMNTKAEQGASVAMGTGTRAAGWGSVAMGYNTIAKPRTLLVIGRNNDTTCISEGFGWWNENDPAFIIGNGVDNENRSNAFTVLQNGYTAIGHEDPTETLDVNGNARFRSVSTGTFANDLSITSDGILTTQTSDKRLKTNINPLENSIEKVLKLNGYTFNWKSEVEGKRDAGLIAQEVIKIFPEAVFINPYDGYYGLNYSRFSALFVEAFKEQNCKIEEQQKIIQTQKEKILDLEND